MLIGWADAVSLNFRIPSFAYDFLSTSYVEQTSPLPYERVIQRSFWIDINGNVHLLNRHIGILGHDYGPVWTYLHRSCVPDSHKPIHKPFQSSRLALETLKALLTMMTRVVLVVHDQIRCFAVGSYSVDI